MAAIQCSVNEDAHQPPNQTLAAGGLPRWELYRLLSDTTRLRLLALGGAHELAVSELAELLRLGQPKVSRHATALRDAGLLRGRKQGNWVLLRLAPQIAGDAVVADALRAGTALCEADGTLNRIADVVARRDEATREFFERGEHTVQSGPPAELASYLRLVASLLGERGLAVDAGTGNGALLEVLAPLFERVVAVDRSSTQLELARRRATQRQFRNVRFVCGEIDGPELRRALGATPRERGRGASRRAASRRVARSAAPNGSADAVFAARVLHHAPLPAKAMIALAALARPPAADRPGGTVLVLDYLSHGDEALREQQADLWLGFEPAELGAMAEGAGLADLVHGTLPAAWCGDGADSHLGWQWLVGRRGASPPAAHERAAGPKRHSTAAKRGRTERKRR